MALPDQKTYRCTVCNSDLVASVAKELRAGEAPLFRIECHHCRAVGTWYSSRNRAVEAFDNGERLIAWFPSGNSYISTVPLPIPQENAMARKPNPDTQTDPMPDFDTDTTSTKDVAIQGALEAGKLVLAAQAQRAAVAALKKGLRKLATPEQMAMLDTPLGDAMLQIMAPLAVHAVATKFPNMVPQNKLVASAADYAYEGTLIRFGLQYSDLLIDMAGEMATEFGAMAEAGRLLDVQPEPEPTAARRTKTTVAAA